MNRVHSIAMDSLSISQVTEQVTLYENKIKSRKEKIKAELEIRKQFKEQLNEAKKHEAAQIMVLERFDEYEEIVAKQLEAAEKMEEPESAKLLAEVETYETMVRKQQQVWSKYEEEYEQLPLAQERKKAEIRLMNVIIQNELVKYKLIEINKMTRMKEKIRKRQEQLQIIELAKLYVGQKKKADRYFQLLVNVRKRENEEQELRQQIEVTKRQIEEKKSQTTSKSVRSQQLPKVDLSCYIIRKDNYNNYDAASVNSYILEQEYMNVEESVHQPWKNSSKPSSQPNNFEETNETDSMPMDVDIEENDSQNKCSNDSRMDVDRTQASNDSQKSQAQPNQVATARNFEHNSEPTRQTSSTLFTHKKSSQDSQMEYRRIESRSSPQKQMNQQNVTSGEIPSKGYLEDIVERMDYSSLPLNYKRPVPSPAKMQKQSMEQPQKQQYQAHQQQQQRTQHHEQRQQQKAQQQPRETKNKVDFIFSNIDVARLPEPQKTPVPSNDNVEYPTKQFQQMLHFDREAEAQSFSMTARTENLPKTSSPINLQQSHLESPKPQDNSIFMDQQLQEQKMPTSVFNRTINSGDINMYGDNISAILGSEITEPGGSYELVQRLYGDSDVISEGSDVDIAKMIEKFGSPIQLIPKSQETSQQQQQQPENVVSQASVNSLYSNIPLMESQEQREKSFALKGFDKKSDNSKSLF